MVIPDDMIGVWLEGGKLDLRRDLRIPEPPAGEALIRVLRAGICNTDLELVRGYYPFCGVLGHEFVGQVVEGPKGWLGKRVVGEINASCGVCPRCSSGRPTHCARRTVLGIVGRNGAFAEYTTLPCSNLHQVPDSVTTDEATFVEPLAAALEIQEQLEIGPGQRVLVVGDGKLGLLVAQTLGLTGCDLTVAGRHRKKLEILERRGISTELVTDRQASADRGEFDLAVECTGNADGFRLARQALTPRGTLVLKSTYAGELTLDASSLVVDEITVVGSRCGPFLPAIELLERRRVEVEPLIEAKYPLKEGLRAFERAGARGALKILLAVDERQFGGT